MIKVLGRDKKVQQGRTDAGFFSSAKALTLPVGPALEPRGVRGYPIDMRAKAQTPAWPLDSKHRLDGDYVRLIQYGLGCWERFVAGEGDRWLDVAVLVGRYLLDKQEPDGAWLNQWSLRHTFFLDAPWKCAMAQGEGASLLVRLYLEIGDSAFANAALKALKPLYCPTSEGGVCVQLNGTPWPEEFPANPPALVLNGAIFSWWGLRDVAIGLDDDRAAGAFEQGVSSLAANLYRFDTGSWSLYCLRSFPVAPVASSFYHALHIAQLQAMNSFVPREEFVRTRQRWTTYLDSPRHRWDALARKIAFRMLVPRSPLVAQRLPWARG